MLQLASKNVPKNWLKRRKKDQVKLTTYWSNLYPEDYAKKMTADYENRLAATFNALKKLASEAKDVVFVGELRQTRDGFVYVDVPNSIFAGFMPFLGNEAEKPPKNERHYDDIGAHITVIKTKEISERGIRFEDVGKKISYKITGVEQVDNPDGWEEMQSVWFLKVEAPQLEKLRQKYGLSPRIKDHDFHITLAVKRRPVEDTTLV